MPEKHMNTSFGPAALLREEIAEFLAGCEDPPAVVEAYRGAANSLAFLVVHPEEMADASWFAGFYAAHPRFTLEFMVAMRRALARKSMGEKWLHSFDGMARQQMKDEAIVADLAERGVKIKPTELRTAREKIAAKKPLRRKRKHP